MNPSLTWDLEWNDTFQFIQNNKKEITNEEKCPLVSFVFPFQQNEDKKDSIAYDEAKICKEIEQSVIFSIRKSSIKVNFSESFKKKESSKSHTSKSSSSYSRVWKASDYLFAMPSNLKSTLLVRNAPKTSKEFMKLIQEAKNHEKPIQTSRKWYDLSRRMHMQKIIRMKI